MTSRIATLAFALAACGRPTAPPPVPPPAPRHVPETMPDETPSGPAAIGGVVRDIRTGAPLPDALVILRRDDEPPARERMTDAHGAFTFTDLTPGRHTVQTLYRNANTSRTVELAPGQHHRLDITVDPDFKPRIDIDYDEIRRKDGDFVKVLLDSSSPARSPPARAATTPAPPAQ